MSNLESKIKDIITDLKTNHNVIALKSEFETEGATYEETRYLADLAKFVGLDLTVKIGGCAAVNDIKIVKELVATTIVAPMIESAYAVEKFVDSVNRVYENKNKPNLFINIETVSGINNIDEIINNEYYKDIKGVVFGRSDMAKSLGQNCSYVDSEELLQISQKLCEKILNSGKLYTIGGGISPKSYNFLKSIKISNFETRKIIFDRKELNNENSSGIIKAIEFEILWYKNKSEMFKNSSYSDSLRLDVLQKRYNEHTSLNL